MDELELERESLISQWKAELEAERETLEPPSLSHILHKALLEPCLETITSFLTTAEVFIANLPLTIGAVGLSWVTMGTNRLYRTGDLVRLLPEGSLDFVGRIKSGSSYIKLRGFRLVLLLTYPS